MSIDVRQAAGRIVIGRGQIYVVVDSRADIHEKPWILDRSAFIERDPTLRRRDGSTEIGLLAEAASTCGEAPLFTARHRIHPTVHRHAAPRRLSRLRPG